MPNNHPPISIHEPRKGCGTTGQLNLKSSVSDLNIESLQSCTSDIPIASTYDILFSAARSSHVNPQPSRPQTNQLGPPAPRQSSLHNFWNLPAPPTSNPAEAEASTLVDHVGTEKCEDCDASLPPSSLGNPSSDDMDVDSGCLTLDDDPRCMGCGRIICPTCAVVEIGLGRECLECRMR